ncbi:MAG: hypothetical protein ACE5JB_10640 [bacterium]
MKLKKVILFIIGMLCMNSVFPIKLQAYVKSRVIIVSGGSIISRNHIGKALTAVIQEANKVKEGIGNVETVREYYTESGYEAFKNLVEKTNFYSTIPEYRSRLLETSTGHYEVRGIKVRVELGETEGDPIQELVFVLNFHLFIENVHYAMETHHYKRILEEGRKLDDMIFRQQILDFLEEFRTAHNRKDIDYLEKAYSDDALIIVGRVLKKQEIGNDYLASSSLGASKIQFIRLSKKEYIQRLRHVFKLNSFVRVIFDDVEIVQHKKYPDIYGIKLRQRWNSSHYSDEGYLFVMMDFMNPDKPLIHVRAWQPEKFEDGSVVGLGDFEIID